MDGVFARPASWNVSLDDLKDATPQISPIHLHGDCRAPHGLNRVIARLRHHQLLPRERAKRVRVVRALRQVRMDLFCGYFMPRFASHELFELAITWTAVLWLADDALDKADSPAALRHAIDMHRAFLVQAIERGPVANAGSPLAALVAEYFARLDLAAPKAVASDFRKAALGWLYHGALRLAGATAEGRFLAVSEHIEARRWDGAVDCCQANLAACLPALPQGFLARSDVQELRRIGATHIALLNDLVSYDLEVGSVVRTRGFCADTNIVSAIQREHGLDPSQAAARVVTHLRTLRSEYRQLARAIAAASTRERGEGAPEAIAAFVEGVGRMMQGNLLWSMQSERYRSQHAPLAFLRAGTQGDPIPLLQLAPYDGPHQATRKRG